MIKINSAVEENKFLPIIVRGTLGVVFMVMCVTVLENFLVQAQIIPPPPPPPATLELTDLVLGDPNEPTKPGKGIFIRAENVVPNGGTFYTHTIVTDIDGITSYGWSGKRTFWSSELTYMNVIIENSWSEIKVEVYDVENGTLLHSKTWLLSLELTDLVLANPDNINEPGNGIYVKTENVVPDGGTFFVATRVVKPYSTIYGISDTRQLFNNTFLYTYVTIREGYEDWLYIEVGVYDKICGILLCRKVWYPSSVTIV